LFTAEFAAELATILLVGVILKLVSRWKGLERDEFDRHFLAGIGSLLSAILLLIVAKTGTMWILMLGMALFYFMIAWGAKRTAEKDAREAVAD